MNKILIVDDQKQNLYLLKTLLEGHGYQVLEATNGAEALGLARADAPDVIISDILMPVMDGFSLCQEWQKDDGLRNIPFVFYTATYTDPKDEELALSLGAARFIVKPVEIEEFVSILEQVITDVESGTLAVPQKTIYEETTYYRMYNETLIRKLEDKMLELEKANRALKEDIAERKQVEQERENLVKELTHKNAQLESFTYIVSHDLKSPLVTMKGFLGYMEQDVANGKVERLKGDTRRIANAVDKMDQLLEDLLALSHVDHTFNSPEIIPFDELVRAGLEAVQGRIEARDIAVKIQPDLPSVYVDRIRLVEVLQNLLDNAAKYMGDQPEPRIEIGQRGEDAERSMSLFYIKDNGMGIAPEYRERIFGLFNKLDAFSEGTGIGLALVKRIIEFHGGRIWVESEAGVGSTFFFTLPSPRRPESDSVK